MVNTWDICSHCRFDGKRQYVADFWRAKRYKNHMGFLSDPAAKTTALKGGDSGDQPRFFGDGEQVSIGSDPAGGNTLRIAQAQINPIVGDLSGNSALITGAIGQARAMGAALVVAPELAVCGYPPEDLLLKPRFLADCRAALDGIAPATGGITAIVGFPEGSGGAVYNSAAVFSDGLLKAIYRKIELPNYGVFDERRYFQPGSRGLLIQLGGRRIMVTICEDLWIAGNSVEKYAVDECAELVVNLSSSPFNAGKLGQRLAVLSGFAQRTGCMVSYTNLVGGQDELVFDGGSLVLSPEGALVACAARFEPSLIIHDLEPPRKQGPAVGQAQTIVIDGNIAESEDELAPVCRPEMGPLDEIIAALELGVRDYLHKNGFAKAVLGLSGGIDSALTAALAVRAMGAENVVGVTMPSLYTSDETRSDAELLAANLGIKLLTVPVKNIYEVSINEMAQALGPGKLGVEAENLQARIRGNILMTLSNRFGWLVLTTGNKSETAVGYCTLYGDMAGGFALIKDVPKTLVYQLAQRVNELFEREVIPPSTIERPPTAELRPDQKDSDSLPEYDDLDPLLKAYVEDDKVLDEVAALGHAPKDTVARVVRMVDVNEYKRRQAPPGVKITPKAFGRDRRLPITNRYRPGWES